MNAAKIPRILVVDDEKDLCEILEFNLSSEGFIVEIAYSAEEALKKPLEDFDLVLLDVMMGEMSGYKLASKMRKELKLSVPVIFLTAKNDENDILTGFNVGGDDYITKPFSIKEMIARIKALLKRGVIGQEDNHLFEVNQLELNTKNKSVTLKNVPVDLTIKEYEILAMLLKNRGHYIGRNEILDRAWNKNVIVTERNVDVTIARLRKKIGEYGKCIKGKAGYGYTFEIPE